MLARMRITGFAIFLMVNLELEAQPLHEYYFNNTLGGTSGAPALVENLDCSAGAGYFSPILLVSSLGICSLENIFNFNPGGGLKYQNPSYINDEYTIHVFCKFNNTIGRFRLLDFSNGSSDPGIYLQNSCLNIAPSGVVGTCPFLFASNQFYLFSFVRTASNDLLTVYVDGVIFGTFNDAAKMYISPTPTAPIVFFKDDSVIPCEAKAGGVKYACVTSQPFSAIQILTTWLNLCAKILPINLSQFEAKTEDNKVLVHWKTESKVNKTFEIERSSDAQNFTMIGEIPAENETGDFTFYDNFPEQGVNYYRLKQVDHSGDKDYSTIAQVNFEKERAIFYPNPANDIIHLNKGLACKQMILKTILGNEMPVQRTPAGGLNTSDLPEGVYFLSLDNTTYPVIIKH